MDTTRSVVAEHYDENPQREWQRLGLASALLELAFCPNPSAGCCPRSVAEKYAFREACARLRVA